MDELKTMVRRNALRLRIEGVDVEGQRFDRKISAIGLKANFVLCNNHFFKGVATCTMSVFVTPEEEGVSGNLYDIPFNVVGVVRDASHDLALFCLNQLPMFKDITKYFPIAPIEGSYSGTYVGLDGDCYPYENDVRALTKRCLRNYYLGNIEVWQGQSQKPTKNGNCGTALVVDSSTHRMILGIHTLGNGCIVGATTVTQKEINLLIALYVRTVDPMSRFVVDPGVIPVGNKLGTERELNFCVDNSCNFAEMEIRGDELEDCLPQSEEKKDLSEHPMFSLIPLNAKSPFRFIDKGVARVFGSLDRPRPHPKSRVTKSPLFEACRRRGIQETHGPPAMKGWQVPYNAAVKLVKGDVQFCEMDLKEIAQEMLEHFMEGIGTDKKLIEIYDDETALNGADGIRGVTSMNRNTSNGFPHYGIKRKFMVERPEDPSKVDFAPEMLELVRMYEDKARRGIKPNCVYSSAFKDEVRPIQKILDKKTRAFFVGSTPAVHVGRKYFLWLNRLVQKYQYVFKCAMGINANSTEWTQLRLYLTQFGLDKLVAGDFKDFDATQMASALYWCFWITWNMAEQAGWNDSELLAMKAISMDIIHAIYLFNGDLVDFMGNNPSGQILTTIINSFWNVMMLMFVYKKLNPEHEIQTFWSNVAVMTYGDDNIMGVSDHAPWFNHTAIADAFEEVNVGYTMADKEAKSVPYIHINECNFLKRTWTWSIDQRVWLAQLEEQSIMKSLLFVIPSNAIDIPDQMCAVLHSAALEYWNYGPDVYYEKCKLFINIAYESGIVCYLRPFKSYAAIEDMYWKNSGHAYKHIYAQNEGLRMSPVEQELSVLMCPDCTPLTDITDSAVTEALIDSQRSLEWVEFVQRALDEALPVSEDLTTENGRTSVCDKEPPNNQQQFKKQKREVSEMLNIMEMPDLDFMLEPQSDNVGGQTPAHHQPKQVSPDNAVNHDNVEQVEVAKFVDDVQGEMAGHYAPKFLPTGVDFTESNADMGKFLNRPVRIWSHTWLESDTVGTVTTLQPWNLFMNDPKVKYKLNNFAWIQGDLHIKVVINASPFYYGSAIFAYYPKGNVTPPALPFTDSAQRYYIPMSQLDHIFIFPQENKGGEMVLPYLNAKNWLQVQKATDLQNFGDLYFAIYAPLLSANGATGTGVSIQVFAWMENAKLSGPSLGLSMQSDDVNPNKLDKIQAAGISYKLYDDYDFDDLTYINDFIENHDLGTKDMCTFLDYVRTGADVVPFLARIKRGPADKSDDKSLFPMIDAHLRYFERYARNSRRFHVDLEKQLEVQMEAASTMSSDAAQPPQNFGQRATGAARSAINTANTYTTIGENTLDEYGPSSGPVSSVASAVAWAAGLVKGIPIIGQYATATQIGASAIARIAAMFGYTNVPNLQPTAAFYSKPFPNLAATDECFPVHKLTMDSKAELGINGQIVGAENSDDLLISTVCGRESYLTKFSFTTANNADDILFTMNPSPSVYDTDGATQCAFYQVPACHIGQLFNAWRGDMYIRIRWICTQFHKARVIATFDPAGYTGENLTNDALVFNAVFNEIIDITPDANTEFRIPYNQATPWLRTVNVNAGNKTWQTGTAPTFNYNSTYHNGTFMIRVLTALTAPVASATIYGQVFVRMAENFEFGMPRELDTLSEVNPLSWIYPQADMGTVSSSLGPIHDPAPGQNLVNFGEKIISLRQVLQRKMWARTEIQATTATYNQIFQYTIPRLPRPFGYDPNGIDVANKIVTTGSTYTFNYDWMTTLNWIVPLFLGNRGSTDWVVNVTGVAPVGQIRAVRSGDKRSLGTILTVLNGVTNTSEYMFEQRANSDCGHGGSCIINQTTQSGLTFQFPNYSRYRFAGCGPLIPSANNLNDMADEAITIELEVQPIDNAEYTPYVQLITHVGAGTDFNLVHFLFVPVLYRYSSLPTTP